MTSKKKEEDSASAPALQSEEARAAILANSSAARGTAIGQQKLVESGEQEVPSGADRGATNAASLAGAEEATSDHPEGPSSEPTGAQAEPAIYTTNGTLPVGMMASSSGPIPTGAVVDVNLAQARSAEGIQSLEDHYVGRTNGAEYPRVPRATLERMSAAEIRAVAQDRAYDLGDNGSGLIGRRAAMRAFINAQNEDLGAPKKGEE